MGVSSGRGGDGNRGVPPHWGVHKEASDNHDREVGPLAGICILHGGGKNAGDEPDGALVKSRRGKRAGGINEEKV